MGETGDTGGGRLHRYVVPNRCDVGESCAGGLPPRVADEPPVGGPAWWKGLDSPPVRRRGSPARAWWTGAAACAAPVLLEIGEVGVRHRTTRRRQAWIL